MTVTIVTDAGVVASGPTTQGIIELVAGSGVYSASLTAPGLPGNYSVVWSTGGATPEYASEDLVIVASSASQPGAALPPTPNARNTVRHLLRDGTPWLDATPVPFNMVRLEELSDQIQQTATPTQTVFQLRFANVPTEQYMTVSAVPGTLVLYVDGSWAPTAPTVDVDLNGNFTLPVPPVTELMATYAWQYFSDGAVDQYVDQARQWLREFTTVALVPDGLMPALTHYAAALALRSLARQANIADLRAGDSEVSFSDLAKSYITQAAAMEKLAEGEREAYYTRGPEALAPAVDVSSLVIDPFEPLR